FGALALLVSKFVSLPRPFDQMLGYLVYINFFWSFVNLLPLWPLDGGQLYRLGLLRMLKPTTAERVTHITALAVLGLSLYLVSYAWIYCLLTLSTLAMQIVQALQHGSGTPVRRQNKLALELFRNAMQAYERGDDDEASRLSHQ